MSIISDVGGFFAGAAKGVAELAGKAWHAIKWVVSLFSTVFRHVGSAWHDFWHGITALAATIGHLAETLFTATRHLIVNLLPAWASWALRKAVGWARTAVRVAEHVAAAALSKAYHLLRSAITHVERFLHALIRNVIKKVNELVHWIANVGTKVAQLVLHPARLVTWILPHLILPLLKFLISKSAPVMVWIGRGVLAILPLLAHEIEDAISELF